MIWNLYEDKEFLKPLEFSNGKTQEDIIKEVLESIKEGYKIVFIKGVCGTGKSAIALNIIKELGRGSVVVPVKPLQTQYMNDYTKEKYLFTKKGDRMKISTIMGRGNFQCAYGKCQADNNELPCTIEIKEKNIRLISEYASKNPFIEKDNLEIKNIGRFTIAGASPYWSPLLKYNASSRFREHGECRVMSYDAVSNEKFFLHLREHGCGFYEQYKAYVDSDVIIFNSKMYEIENILGRKPVTDVEVIDECDKFLDDLGNERKINLDLLSLKLSQISSLTSGDVRKNLIEFNNLVLRVKEEGKNKLGEILNLKDTLMLKLIKELIYNDQLQEFDDLNMYFETALAFEPFLDETYLSYNKNEGEHIILTLITINLEKRLKEFIDKNKVLVMMSGTIHSQEVLKEIFGLDSFKIIEAETKAPGIIKERLTGLEKNFRFKEFQGGKLKREDYLKALEKCIITAEEPVLVQVNSLQDLPTEEEKKKFELKIKSQEELKEEQQKYKKGELLEEFKIGKTKILYGTKYNRGIDLPGETCRSIVLTKYPYPGISSLFWRVLRMKNKEKFLKFYFDKADREFLQRIYRGLRSKTDKIYLLSPDVRCFERLRKKFSNVL